MNQPHPIDRSTTPLFINDYDVVLRLGGSVLHDVFKVRSRDGSHWALKRLNWEFSVTGSERLENFLEEADRLLNIHHPHLVPGRESAFDAEGRPFFTMEYASMDLAKAATSGLRVGEVLAHLVAVASALDYLHETADCCHGDVKPENIFLFDEGDPRLRVAKLGDLGLVRSFDYGVRNPASIRYAAPELLDGSHIDEHLRFKSDIFSLAVVAIELLVGQPPLSSQRFEPLDVAWGSKLPQAVFNVLRKSMRSEPAARHDTASHLVEELRLSVPPSLGADTPLPLLDHNPAPTLYDKGNHYVS
jgi:serine/threonine protein kinase